MNHTVSTRISRVALTFGLVTGAFIGANELGAQARTTTTNRQLRIENVALTVPGTGSFRVDGGVHVLFHVTRDAAGGFHVKLHANSQGLSAQSTSGGSDYRVNGAANATVNIGAAKDAASTGTAVLNFGLIGQGKAPNLRLHVNLHLTVNANGEVTATVANVRITESG